MNRAQDVVEEFVDDVEDSFLAMCARAPGESLRHAVSPYDLTMFNTPNWSVSSPNWRSCPRRRRRPS
ncbi:hypothetical protein [Streptomyces cinereoruber]|uniref:hypothetical protein n=1 Tax=Streptomyces cinereoruber TaxID=67260 RepID=UPI0033961C0B